MSTSSDDEMVGKVVLITGGSSGIGLSTAIRFSSAGAKIAILARGKERLDLAIDKIKRLTPGSSVLPLICDVTKEKQVSNAFQETIREYGKLDIVVSNAGSIRSGSLEETSLDDWEEMIKVHATAYFLVAKEAVKVFRRQGEGGVIVFNNSDNAIKPSKNMLAYSAAKAAELHLARCIAEEYGGNAIRINSVLPGAVFGGSSFWTPEYRKARAKTHGFDPDTLEDEYKKNSALGVVILPEEVAEVIYFLASDRSSKITGTVISIDGGGKTGYLR